MTTQHTNALSLALDYYVFAAILYHRNGGHDHSVSDHDVCREDLVKAIDALITARIRDLVKVG